MIRGKFDQARCAACGSWHFAVTFKEESFDVKEYKCCRCGRIIQPLNLKKVENKDEKHKQ